MMAFASLREADTLAWRQASMFARAVEILSDETLAGILRFQGWGLRCDATCADGMWVFRRRGLFWKDVLIEQPGDRHEVAAVTTRFISGTLKLPSGESLIWRQLSFWSGESAFMTPSGFAIVKFKPKRFSFRDAGDIVVQREYANHPELPFLIMLGAFMSVANQRRRRS